MKADQRGFTLIEVLVALMILGVSLSAVFQALSSSRRLSLKADESLTAARLAQNILTNPALIDASLKGKAMGGNIDGDRDWRYSLTAQPLEISTGSTKHDVYQVPTMYELNLCLSHVADFREKMFCVKQWYRQ